jgi:hypothetical protein
MIGEDDRRDVETLPCVRPLCDTRPSAPYRSISLADQSVHIALSSRSIGEPFGSDDSIAEWGISIFESFFQAMRSYVGSKLGAAWALGKVSSSIQLTGNSLHGPSTAELEGQIDRALMRGKQICIHACYAPSQFGHRVVQLGCGNRIERKADPGSIPADQRIPGHQHSLRPLWTNMIDPHIMCRSAIRARCRKANAGILRYYYHVAH